MSRKQGDLVGQSMVPTRWGCDSGAGCCAPLNVTGIPYTGRSRFAGPSANVSGRPHFVGMRPSATAASLRHAARRNPFHDKEEAA
jgi:hypothetical protein